MSPSQDHNNSQYRWIILIASFFAFVAFAFAFQLAPPLIPAIINEFKISHAEAGLLMSLVRFPGIFLGIPAGLFVSRYGTKLIGAFSLVCVVLGCLVTATANSFTLLLTGRLILGIGGGIIIPTASATVAKWFSKEEIGKAMGLYGINGPFALIVAFPSASLIMLAYDWRFPFYIGAAIAIAAAIVFFVATRKSPPKEQKRKTNIRRAIRNLEIWKVGIIWLFYSSAILAFTTWAPILFEKFKGISLVDASFLASLVMWIAIICNPLYGWLSDRTGKRKLFVVTGFFLTMLSFIAVAYASNLMLIVSVIVLGITSAILYPVMSALPLEILGPNLVSIGFGITGTCINIGVALSQPVVGLILDITVSYQFSLLGLAVLSAIGTLVAYSLKVE
jgi:predicted MFS family arabinose efflux permease